jgi:hypothetical protein
MPFSRRIDLDMETTAHISTEAGSRSDEPARLLR